MRRTTIRATVAAVSAALMTIAAPLSSSHAAVVGNDTFSAAAPLANGATVVADTTDATREDGELPPFQADVRAGAPDTGCNGGASVWYALPGGTGALSLTASSSSFDAVLALWQGDSPAPAITDLTATNYSVRAPAGSAPATLNATLPVLGGYYFLEVDSCNTADDPAPASLGSVSVSATLQPRPKNDTIASAHVLADHSTVIASTVGASIESTELPAFQAAPLQGSPAYGCYGGSSVWYRLKHGASYLRLKASHASFDTVIALWESDVPSVAAGDLTGTNVALRPQNPAFASRTVKLNPASYYWLDVDTCNQTGSTINEAQGAVTLRTDYQPPLPPGYSGATKGVGESPLHARGVTTKGFSSYLVPRSLHGSTHGLQSSRTNTRVVIRYVGTTLVLHLEQSWRGGRVRIIVDRNTYLYDLYVPTKKPRDLVVKYVLPRGKHTVALNPQGRNPLSHGGLVRLWLLSIRA